MNDHNDTTKRQFPVGTVLQITCQGQIGSDPNKVSIITIHYERRTFFKFSWRI